MLDDPLHFPEVAAVVVKENADLFFEDGFTFLPQHVHHLDSDHLEVVPPASREDPDHVNLGLVDGVESH